MIPLRTLNDVSLVLPLTSARLRLMISSTLLTLQSLVYPSHESPYSQIVNFSISLPFRILTINSCRGMDRDCYWCTRGSIRRGRDGSILGLRRCQELALEFGSTNGLCQGMFFPFLRQPISRSSLDLGRVYRVMLWSSTKRGKKLRRRSHKLLKNLCWNNNCRVISLSSGHRSERKNLQFHQDRQRRQEEEEEVEVRVLRGNL